ncbi:T9SS type A sorting domain-containing protein [Mangrovibacterium sp.]|uniref:T9SS type A sorting domain-containing protein n=1 Tax=Mangrovibacterium sp. TaxID=1961364 RepID=UPI003562B984
MKRLIAGIMIFGGLGQIATAQVVLDANGPGDTYELINSVLAPGYTAVETPDCGHLDFGRHIDEVFDNDLNTNVFRFFIHANIDNDRCEKFDRQRNEIKTYDQSPDNLKAVIGETVVYNWKFKLPEGFQSSSSFTHIHQLKGVGGEYEDMPLITFTTRKGTPDKLELRYAAESTQTTLTSVDLTPFKGVWVEVTESVSFATVGSYSVTIKTVDGGTVLLSYENNSLNTYKEGASFLRPKWGIYRSLNNVSDLRDEEVLFASFSINELITTAAADNIVDVEEFVLIPNPATNTVKISGKLAANFSGISIYNKIGQKVMSLNEQRTEFSISSLKAGLYFLTLITPAGESKPAKLMKIE